MNPDIERLQSYPFEKLATLKRDSTPPDELKHIALSIGEPKHQPPEFVLREFTENIDKFSAYPSTKGLPQLRDAIARWATTRFQLNPGDLNPENNILPVSGTREALFSFTQACINKSGSAAVLMPNPFYQIYEGATLLADAEPVFLNCLSDNGFVPDFDSVSPETWAKCQLLIICSPGNPTGAVIAKDELKKLIRLADTHNFVIASDECYSEIYRETPPPGAMEVAAEVGADPERVLVFHSLSKRSNLAGLRSGFVAGGPQSISRIKQLRAYAGAPLPLPLQRVAEAVWQDEAHVVENRALYNEKYALAEEMLGDVPGYFTPEGGFFLWLPVADGEATALRLWREAGVRVLPGDYLSRPDATGESPGKGYIRVALVAPKEECKAGLARLADALQRETR